MKRNRIIKYLIGLMIISLVTAILVCIGLLRRDSENTVTKEQLDSLGLEHITKLMIVAHPDDESIWGGAHLLQDDYLVVCLTNGDNSIRSKEFSNALSISGDIPLMLRYPDKEFHMRSRWIGYSEDILKDLETLLSYKKWEEIAVHNPQGEYGHLHHIRTSYFVTFQREYAPNAKLFYFGEYYSKKNIGNAEKLERISDELLDHKNKMLECYISQDFIWKKFGHMFPYENWTEYSGK